MSNKTNYVNHGENVNVENKDVNVTGTAEVKGTKSATVKNSSISAGNGVNIRGGSVNIQGSSIISGKNVVIGGDNVVLDNANIVSSDNLEINSQNTKVQNEVNLEAAKAKLKGQSLEVNDDSQLNVKAQDYSEEVDNKVLGNNASINVNGSKEDK
ncbi:hypothetical protein CKF54_00605 [Psittacicella hinzii]|uniref:Uncharacterized protein n=1 Tax=Psittacicella hinzii TaxID=2028575 RepID=A0A3A1YA65_9GAMM|nr:hypothetical protein [Psittacicella hinzii]RIY34431.1 hypothetical protein CKF54_00605 [Psittacicella hinzii]